MILSFASENVALTNTEENSVLNSYGCLDLDTTFTNNDVSLFLFEPIKIGNHVFYKRNVSDAEFEVLTKQDNNAVQQSISSKTDLVPNRYEGGLKTWECSIDLVLYLQSRKDSIENLNVLELGAGSGLPGIFCLQNGANAVHFQDYNAQVLEVMTVPNVHVNTVYQITDKELLTLKNNVIDVEIEPKKLSEVSSKMYYGDWGVLASTFPESFYDLILTSETIYSARSYSALIQIFDRCLKPSGKILLAAKRFYFGLDGSLLLFQQFLNDSGIFHYQTVWSVDHGVPREILEITRK